jgi:hypothetical protein
MPTAFHQDLFVGDNIPPTLGHFVGYLQLFLRKNKVPLLNQIARVRQYPPDERISGYRWMMTGGTIEQEHIGLGG